jgi:phosphatidylinositol alpha-1,6-mannosyltransferase
LWVIGDGPERTALEAQCVDLGIKDRVAFLGRIERPSLDTFYQNADLFCLPSRHLESKGDVEGLGLVFLEAQQRAVPVVGTDSGGIPEAVSDGGTGLIVEEGNSSALREAIRRIAESPETHEGFSEAGPAFVERKFSWSQCVQNHIDAYRGVE